MGIHFFWPSIYCCKKALENIIDVTILVHLLRKCNSYTLFWCLYTTLSYAGPQTANHSLLIFCVTNQAVYVDIETKHHEPRVYSRNTFLLTEVFIPNLSELCYNCRGCWKGARVQESKFYRTQKVNI